MLIECIHKGGSHTRYKLNQEPAIIEGMVNTHWPTTVFENMVNPLYRKTLLTCNK